MCNLFLQLNYLSQFVQRQSKNRKIIETKLYTTSSVFEQWQGQCSSTTKFCIRTDLSSGIILQLPFVFFFALHTKHNVPAKQTRFHLSFVNVESNTCYFDKSLSYGCCMQRLISFDNGPKAKKDDFPFKINIFRPSRQCIYCFRNFHFFFSRFTFLITNKREIFFHCKCKNKYYFLIGLPKCWCDRFYFIYHYVLFVLFVLTF